MNDFSTNKTHISFELLTDYVDGILDAPSNSRISTHLKKCAECADTVSNIQHYYENYGGDRESFDNYLKKSKSNILSALQKARVKEDEPLRVRGLRYYAIRTAATLLIISIPTIILILNHQIKSGVGLVDGYISIPYHNPPITRGNSDQIMKHWGEIAYQYEHGNYAEAIPTLELIIRQAETLPMAHFYTGLCYLYLEDGEKAIFHLQEVVSSESPYYQQGLWYLSLAYFQADQIRSSKETLEKITSYKQKEVQELLNILNN